MKYLKMYEAFKSNVLSNVIKHVKKKIGKSNIDMFIKALNTIQSIYEFPIDKIETSDLKYLTAKKALKIKPAEDTVYYNNQRIYKIKFWFSIEKGYLFTTGVGDYKKSKTDGFTDREMDYIKNNLGIKKGTLTKIGRKDYGKLNTGDKVIGFLDTRSLRNLCLFTIYIDNGELYAIQNTRSGSSPRDYGDNEWTQYGEYAWILGHPDYPNGDHTGLFRYTEDDTDIDADDEDVNLRSDLQLQRDGSLNRSSEFDFQKADFAIVLDINNIFKKGFEKVTDTRSKRKENRKGATKFMTNDEIKSMNIERYLVGILDKMGIKGDIEVNKINNLQKFANLVTLDKFAFYSIYNNSPSIENLFEISKTTYTLIEEKEEYYYHRLVDIYKKLKRATPEIKKDYINYREIINNGEIESLKEVFNKIDNISMLINEIIKSNNINTIHDLNIMYHRVKYIQNILRDYTLKLSRTSSSLIRSFTYPDDIRSYLSDDDREKSIEDDMESDMKKLVVIEKTIKKLL